MSSSLQNRFFLGIIGLISLFKPSFGIAGVFNLPHLAAPGEFAFGIQPEFLMTPAVSAGVELRYVQGITDSANFTGILGTGSGSRQFRVGGAGTFDFFPDTGNQPGIGVAFQALLIQVNSVQTFEATAIPYVHKTFSSSDYGNIEPFLALPVGLSLFQGTYQPLLTVAVGCIFLYNEHFRSVVELGLGLNQASTYLSGGLIYYH